MANRKRKREAQKSEKFEWNVEQTAFLLAWLDYCVEDGRGRTFFTDTVVVELKRRWNRDFTWERIINKLKSIHRVSYDSEITENKPWRAILNKGTSCLDFDFLKLGLKDALK